MKNLRSALSLLLALCCSIIVFTGCSPNNNSNNKETDSSNLRYYKIDLSLENYWKFLDWDKRNNQFYGVLTFAYYEDVVVTLKRTIFADYTENTYTENYSIELNAAGCNNYTLTSYSVDEVKTMLNYTGWASSYSSEVTLIGIKGNIQFSV